MGREAGVGKMGSGSEIAGIVRRDGEPTAARVEVRLLRTIEEESEHNRPGGYAAPGAAQRQVERLKAPPAATVPAGEDGRFSVGGLSPAFYAVLATAPDGAVGRERAALLLDGTRDEVAVDLFPAKESLRGRVLRADGSPWRGTVLVLPIGAPFSLPDLDGAAAAALDAEGRFTATGLEAGQFVACALAADGARALSKPLRVPYDGDYPFAADADRTEVRGRVVAASDGKPVAGAEVAGTESWPMDYGSLSRAVTDREGRFSVLVPSPSGLVSVRVPGFVDSETPVFPPKKELEIRVARSGSVRGRVTLTPEGRAGPSVRVSLTPTGRDDGTGRRDRKTLTDAEGTYEFAGLAEGEYAVFARGAGRVSSNFSTDAAGRRTASVVPGADATLDLAMVPGARVVGMVRDAGGTPVQGARVLATRSPTFTRDGGEETPPWSAYADIEDASATGPDGSYAIGSLVPGTQYEVFARGVGAPSARKRRVTTVAGADVRADLSLPSPRWVDVTVVASDTGAPIASATASAFVAEEPAEGETDESGLFSSNIAHISMAEQVQARTDTAGHARVGPIGPGRAQVIAAAPGFADPHHGPFLDAVEGPPGVLSATVRLERGRAISGRVVLPDGAPAVGAQVTLTTVMGRGSSVGAGTRTDERGDFQFPNLGEGDHRLSALFLRDGQYDATTPVAAGATDVTLVLSKGPGPRRILAVVLDPRGNPVPSARAMYSIASAGFGGIVTDGRLEFDLTNEEELKDLVGAVVVERAASRDGAPLPLGRSRTEGVRPGQSIEIVLPAERVIEGVVLGPNGKGVAGARVRADAFEPSDPDGSLQMEQWMWSQADAVRTDAAGAFRIGHLGEGAHWVVVLPPPTFSPPRPVKESAGAVSLRIKVTAGAAAAVRIVDPKGAPVPGARVALKRRRGSQDLSVVNLFADCGSGTERATGADGVARFEGLDPSAEYALGVRAPAARLELAESLDERWTPADATIRLEPGFRVAGVVRDPSKRPVAGAWVSCERESGLTTSQQTGADGTFLFTGLGAGTVNLDARVLSFEHKRGVPEPRARKVVPAGTGGIVLVLE